MKRYELTTEQWKRVRPLLPPEETGERGRPRKDNRTMLNGMLWIARSGAQWRDMENLSIDSTCIKVHESANGGGKNGG